MIISFSLLFIFHYFFICYFMDTLVLITIAKRKRNTYAGLKRVDFKVKYTTFNFKGLMYLNRYVKMVILIQIIQFELQSLKKYCN